MSHSYRRSSDDFLSQDMYADSYQQGTRSASLDPMRSRPVSSEGTSSNVHLPGMAASFLQSCGLDSSDLAYLAELPEHLITVETLPNLLRQMKEHKLPTASSSRSSSTRPRHVSPPLYPVAPSEHKRYSRSPREIESWQDSWRNPRLTDSSSGGNPIGRGLLNDAHYNSQDYTSSASNAFSYSSGDYDDRPKPLLSRLVNPHDMVPTWKEASDYNNVCPPVFPAMCVLCDVTIFSERVSNTEFFVFTTIPFSTGLPLR